MSVLVNVVRRSFYLDSVALMRLSRQIAGMPGVVEAALMMGTPANRQIMQEAHLLDAEGQGAAGNDLIIGVRAQTQPEADAAANAAFEALDAPREKAAAAEGTAKSLGAALNQMPDASFALISVPGEFAAVEAHKAIRAGLDVMIFSDNVSYDDEVRLKQEAQALGRLVMGPDCGTAIINGTPLAFANVVPRGDIGIIGASGTGTQEVTCLIAQAGRGISQAIGVGGRDLSQKVGGISTLTAIDILDSDPETQHIVLISKPPHPDVAKIVLDRVARSAKPFTICFLGDTERELPENATAAPTLGAAAQSAMGQKKNFRIVGRSAPPGMLRKKGVIVGLFAGGTLCAEAQLVLASRKHNVTSNAPVPGASPLVADGANVDRLLDLGADEYTKGRPHPMIDPSVRDDMLRQSMNDTNVAIILLDCVIGYGAHADPAGQVAAVLADMPKKHPYLIASVTGTEEDPQVRSRQIATLKQAGVLVADSNADAAALAAALVS
ncbi:succinyl-CoA ligase [ADP-forming] subunit alpha [Variibacter gotjawalensis]|uniref:Succinyl-CoA ligase [ADP-forming] subunit alpha n=1 Tax=Variibacter gotjawalensis TaxID=1333996 RepID=A0A0S3PSW7_9BRAD|nr:acyl-CoA synthetase FdrA [Variibacter gotjawalensis]NIK49319.1 FdrA protein [Variibacter gotjawalensis]RZS51170.1 FdrA protein [Variibacter gotjawalensis]BAT59005.1 succinyl-CoA ligase [ADP-forming] subunit alpha [Variibacter gotjawalensis]